MPRAISALRQLGATFALTLALAFASTQPAAAQEVEPPGVLLLTPTPVEDTASWAAVGRALHTLGRRILQVADLPIDPVFAACRASACARKAAQAAHVPAALFSLESGLGGAAELTLRLYGPNGAQVALRTARAGVTLEQGALLLFERAERQLALGDAALLQVSTVPAGALVTLDGEPIGTGPVERNLREGRHVVRVSCEGFGAQERTLELHAGRVQSLEFQLARAPHSDALARAEASRAAARREVSPWNYILGGGLAIASLPLLISSVNALANDGQCLEYGPSGCTNRASFGRRSAVMLGAGAVALLGGAYFTILRPLSISVEVAPGRAGFGLQLRL